MSDLFVLRRKKRKKFREREEVRRQEYLKQVDSDCETNDNNDDDDDDDDDDHNDNAKRTNQTERRSSRSISLEKPSPHNQSVKNESNRRSNTDTKQNSKKNESPLSVLRKRRHAAIASSPISETLGKWLDSTPSPASAKLNSTTKSTPHNRSTFSGDNNSSVKWLDSNSTDDDNKPIGDSHGKIFPRKPPLFPTSARNSRSNRSGTDIVGKTQRATIYVSGAAFESPGSSISCSQSISQSQTSPSQPRKFPPPRALYEPENKFEKQGTEENYSDKKFQTDLKQQLSSAKAYESDSSSEDDNLMEQFRAAKRRQIQQEQSQASSINQQSSKNVSNNTVSTPKTKNEKSGSHTEESGTFILNTNQCDNDRQRNDEDDDLLAAFRRQKYGSGRDSDSSANPKLDSYINIKPVNLKKKPDETNYDKQSQEAELNRLNTENDNDGSDEQEDEDDNDDDLLAEFRTMKRKKRQLEELSHVHAKLEISKTTCQLKQSGTIKSRLRSVNDGYPTYLVDDEKNGNSSNTRSNRNKDPPRNPISLMKEEEQRMENQAIDPSSSATRSSEINLWSDSDDEKQSENDKTSKGTSRKSRKKPSSRESQRKRRKERSSVSDSGVHAMDSCVVPVDEEISRLLRMEHDSLSKCLKPDFFYPRFGPFDFKPLLLEGANGMNHEVPASLNRYLLPYQQEGVKFLHRALSKRMGAILGDEMGLGKTVQVIGLLCALLDKKGNGEDALELHQRRQHIQNKVREFESEKEKALLQGQYVARRNPDFTKELQLSPWYPVLVVAPPVTIENWQDEFTSWGYFDVATFAGDHRIEALSSVRRGLAEVLLTSRALFNQKEGFEHLNTIDWKLVIIDEFHLFKGMDGTLSEHLRTLKADHSSLVIGMTGTLMQNDHIELWNLVDLIQKNHLGSWDKFKYSVSIPIKNGRSKAANENLIRKSNEKSQELIKKLSSVYIERKKEDVLAGKLPIKDEHVVVCEPSALQKQIYQHILTLPDFQLLQKAHTPCRCAVNDRFFHEYNKLKTTKERLEYYRKRKEHVVPRRDCCYTKPFNPRRSQPGEPEIDPDAVLWRMHDKHEGDTGCSNCPSCCFFPALHKLNKLSSHVALLQAERTPGSHEVGSIEYTKFMKDMEFAKVAFPSEILSQLPGGSIIRKDGIMDDHFNLSGKMKVLDKLLRKFSREDARVLIFSFSTQTLDLIQNYLRSVGHSFLRMDGSTQSAKRQELVNKFKNDNNIFVFLLSTKAMGLGINLTEANKVIIFDVDWNPSWDAQAQDRAYRIGQKRNVQVLRLVTRGTIEEIKYLRQLYKVQLKQETLENLDVSAPKAARLFRGVQGDKRRKGELFGAENLLKFKDGSFLDDVWKKNGSTESSKTRDLEMHESMKISSSLQKIGEEKCEQLLSEKQELRLCDEAARERQYDNSGENVRGERYCTSERAMEEELMSLPLDRSGTGGTQSNSDFGFGVNALKHEDLLRDDRGGAAIQQGDEGFDEEMGGETQNLVSIYERGNLQMLPDNPQDAEGSYDQDAVVQGSPGKDNSSSPRSDVSLHRSRRHSTDSDTVSTTKTTRHSDRQVNQNCNAAPAGITKTKGRRKRVSDNTDSQSDETLNDENKVVSFQNARTIQLMGISSQKIAHSLPPTTFSASDIPVPAYSLSKSRTRRKGKKKPA